MFWYYAQVLSLFMWQKFVTHVTSSNQSHMERKHAILCEYIKRIDTKMFKSTDSFVSKKIYLKLVYFTPGKDSTFDLASSKLIFK